MNCPQENRAALRVPKDFRNAAPLSSLTHERVGLRKSGKCFCPRLSIQFASPPQFRVTFWTVEKRTSVALTKMVRAVHAALVSNTVPDAEHRACSWIAICKTLRKNTAGCLLTSPNRRVNQTPTRSSKDACPNTKFHPSPGQRIRRGEYKNGHRIIRSIGKQALVQDVGSENLFRPGRRRYAPCR